MSNEFLLSIPAMKCNGCVAAIDKALSAQAGVVRSEIELATKSARVEADLPLPVLIEVLKTAGFDASGSSVSKGDCRA